MSAAEPDVDGCLVKVDHLSLEQLRTMDDGVISRALRRILDDPESQDEDPVAAFNSRI